MWNFMLYRPFPVNWLFIAWAYGVRRRAPFSFWVFLMGDYFSLIHLFDLLFVNVWGVNWCSFFVCLSASVLCNLLAISWLCKDFFCCIFGGIIMVLSFSNSWMVFQTTSHSSRRLLWARFLQCSYIEYGVFQTEYIEVLWLSALSYELLFMYCAAVGYICNIHWTPYNK